MQVGETVENYLETIFMLLKEQSTVRSIDVVRKMGYSKPTISVMMKQLRESAFIEMDESGYITLTDIGLEVAERTYERHVMLTKILIGLGVDEEIARDDACKIEHNLSKESFARIKEHYLKNK